MFVTGIFVHHGNDPALFLRAESSVEEILIHPCPQGTQFPGDQIVCIIEFFCIQRVFTDEQRLIILNIQHLPFDRLRSVILNIILFVMPEKVYIPDRQSDRFSSCRRCQRRRREHGFRGFRNDSR